MPFNWYFRLIKVLVRGKELMEVDEFWQSIRLLDNHEWHKQIFYRYAGKQSPFNSIEIARLSNLFWSEKLKKERELRRNHPYWWKQVESK